MPASNSTDIKLAIYAERLDRYIENQEALNKSLVSAVSNLHTDVTSMQEWRSKMYGVKTALVGVGFLVVHLAVIVGTLSGVSWINNK
tara:strand:+ start:137 stop:397 length:261 start_codon:yes stop_codon:yes gene_type:complete